MTYEVGLWPQQAESRRYARMDPLGDTRWVNHLWSLVHIAGRRSVEPELATYLQHYNAHGGHEGWVERQAATAPYFWLGAEADAD